MCVRVRISLILYSDRTASSVPSIHCVMAQSRDRKAPEESRLLAALRPRLVRTPAQRHASWSGKLGLPCVETEATRSGTMLSISLCGRLFLMVICKTEALTMVPERCFRSDSFCPKSSLVVFLEDSLPFFPVASHPSRYTVFHPHRRSAWQWPAYCGCICFQKESFVRDGPCDESYFF